MLRDGDRDRLEAMLRTPTLPAGLVQRARIVLLHRASFSTAYGQFLVALDRVGVSRPTVNLLACPLHRAGSGGLGG